MQTAYLSLGSNIGRRAQNLRNALRLLAQDPLIRVRRVSRVYETSSVGPRQRKFLNLAVKIQTGHPPLPLLSTLKSIERRMGRVPGRRWGPRLIDLDLIFYGRRAFRSKSLTVPHARFRERRFVLQPLCDLAPSFRPPGLRLRLRSLLAQLTDPTQKVRLTRISIR